MATVAIGTVAGAASFTRTLTGDGDTDAGFFTLCGAGCDHKAASSIKVGNNFTASDPLAGDWEYAVGLPADQPGNVSRQHTWEGAETFELGWNSAVGALSLSFAGYDTITKSLGVGALDSFSSVFFRLDGRNGTSASLSGLTLNGVQIGDGALSVTDSFILAQLSDFDLTANWAIGGFVDISGRAAGSQPSFQIKLTDVAPVPLPAAAWLMLAGLGSLFGLRRIRQAA